MVLKNLCLRSLNISDLANILPVLSTIDSSIQNRSISDLYVYQLGRFDENQTRPRPILVKFLRRMDVTTILSNRNKIERPMVIKADMSKEERKVESLLLQEHWKLIQQGTSHKHILHGDLKCMWVNCCMLKLPI